MFSSLLGCVLQCAAPATAVSHLAAALAVVFPGLHRCFQHAVLVRIQIHMQLLLLLMWVLHARPSAAEFPNAGTF